MYSPRRGRLERKYRRPPYGSRPEYIHTFKPTQVIWGFTERGRAELVHSNKIRATPYGAFKVSVTGGDVKNSWQVGSKTYSVKGKAPLTVPSLAYVGQSASGLHRPSVPSWVSGSARARHLMKVRDTTVNMLEALAETADDLPRMISLLQKLGRALLFLKKGQFKKAGVVLGLHRPKEAIGSYYLAYTLGIRPLMDAIFNAQEAIKKAFSKMKRQTVSSTFVQTVSCAYANSRWTRSGVVEYGVKLSSTFTVESRDHAAIASLGGANPYEILWALAPMSFVIDWFIDVSTFVGALSATNGLSFVGGYETHFSRAKGVILTDHHIYKGAKPEWKVESFCWERIPRNNFVKPGVGMSISLNLQQAGTLTALASQLRR